VTVNLWTEAEHARDYLERRRQIPHREEGYDALLEFLPAATTRVLDLGTGDGEVVARIRARHPDVEVVAADFSAEMLGRARARFADEPAVRVVEHDLEHPIPEAWGSFDVVVSSFAIHHVGHDRKRALYREIYEQLDAGGCFGNLEHVDSPSRELHQAFLDRIGAAEDPSNQLLDVPTQLEWLRALGFEHVDCHWKWRELALLAGVKPG
jgi:cyclopropane fatty-acyl-phospholipid synthase-like methyltransferase